MLYELTVLFRVEGGAGTREVCGEVPVDDMSCDYYKGQLNEMLKGFKINVIKKEYDGVKRLAYDIDGEAYAGYMWYEFEVKDSIAPVVIRAIKQMLNDMHPNVLTYLLVREVSKGE